MKKTILLMLSLAFSVEKELGEVTLNKDLVIDQTDAVDHVNFERLTILPDGRLTFTNNSSIENAKVVMTVEKEAMLFGFIHTRGVTLTIEAKSHTLLEEPMLLSGSIKLVTPLYAKERRGYKGDTFDTWGNKPSTFCPFYTPEQEKIARVKTVFILDALIFAARLQCDDLRYDFKEYDIEVSKLQEQYSEYKKVTPPGYASYWELRSILIAESIQFGKDKGVYFSCFDRKFLCCDAYLGFKAIEDAYIARASNRNGIELDIKADSGLQMSQIVKDAAQKSMQLHIQALEIPKSICPALSAKESAIKHEHTVRLCTIGHINKQFAIDAAEYYKTDSLSEALCDAACEEVFNPERFSNIFGFVTNKSAYVKEGVGIDMTIKRDHVYKKLKLVAKEAASSVLSSRRPVEGTAAACVAATSSTTGE